MSRRAQVHIFWGAPVSPLKMTISQRTASLMPTADPWEKIQLLYHQGGLHMQEESCTPGNLKDCRVLEGAGTPDLVGFVQREHSFLHSASETQDGKPWKILSSCLSPVPSSSVQIRGLKGKAEHLPKEEKHQKLECERKITGEQPEDQSNACGQNFQTESFHLGHKCAAMLDLGSSARHIDIVLEAMETKCVPTESQEIQSQHPELFSSIAVSEPEPVGAVRKGSSSNVSADTEFLSIMTCSQVAFLAQKKAERQMSQNTGTVNVESEPKAGLGEVSITKDNLTQPHEDFMEGHESGQNQAHSLELFSPVHAETESNHIHTNPGKGLERNAGSQELFSCEDEWAPSEIHIGLYSSGILCSQLNACHRTLVGRSEPPKDNLCHSKALSEVPAVSKKMKLCSNARDTARARDQRVLSEFKGIKKLSLIKNCDSKSKKYNCLVLVLTPCHVKEIDIKSGPNSGSKVPLATIVVIDQSDMQKKVVLWRTMAFWALTVFLGDVILLTDIIIYEDKWIGETVLQSTFTSQLLNLGTYSSVLPEEYSSIVSTVVLQDLLAYVSSKHPYLKGLPQRWPQRMSKIEFVELEQLQPDMLVHAVLRVVDVLVLTEALYNYRGQKQRKVVLTVEQAQDQHYLLVLWGRGAAWYSQLQRKKGYIWEFKYLYVQRNCILESLELHTTPWSSSECLFDDDVRAIAFKSKFQRTSSFVKTSDLATHLKDKYSGVVLIKAQIVELVFAVRAAQEVRLNACSSLEHILCSLPRLTYTGCAGCGSELHTDENKIYRQCLSCLPLSGKKTYYRPAFMTIVDGSHVACVHVGSKLIEKILLHISPDGLDRVIVPSSEVTYGMVAADLLHSLLADSTEPQVLKIESRFVLDENSYPLQQDFSLLDFYPAGPCPEALSQRRGAD